MPKLLKMWYQNLPVKQKQQLARTVTNPTIQKLLADDDNLSVLRCLATNNSLHPNAQKILASYANEDIHWWLERNPSSTKATKRMLKKRGLIYDQST